MSLLVDDTNRVRTLTLDRPEALNAFNEELYDATAEALVAAADDPGVAVVLLTGSGRAFSAGTDLHEMHQLATDPAFQRGKHGFVGLVDALAAFPKPLVCAVNGIGLGIGTTVLGFADLAFMSAGARLKCPFTSLGVAPEAASSYLLPRLVGRQNAAWMLLLGRVDRGGGSARHGPGLEGLRRRRPAAHGDVVRREAGIAADRQPGGGQGDDDRTAAGRDRRGPRAGERLLRRAHGWPGQPRGAARVRRGS